LKVYSGYLKSVDELCTVASGGAATALSEYIVQKDGAVFGVAYTDNFRSAEFMCAEVVQDLGKLKSSKYIAPEKKCLVDGEYLSVYTAVERKLSEGKTVLFIGAGCDVGALLKYVENHNCDTTNLYTVDIICHGPTYPDSLSQYVDRLEVKYGANITKFNMRHKVKGTKPPFIYAEFSNGKKFKERLYESDFGYAFQVYKRSACYNCQFKGDLHKADLTLGDYWGCTKNMKEFNQFGVSVMFVRTTKGEELIQVLENSDTFTVNPADMEIALVNNPAFYIVRTKNQKLYDKFQKDMNEHGLHYAVRKSTGYKGYVKRAIKKRLQEIIQK
jgi:coenzyme F420-reducing hydrogenase beta subunit